MLISGDLKCICFGFSAQNRDRNISEIQRETETAEPEHILLFVSVGFYIQLWVHNNLRDFISHISSHRVRCLRVEGCIWLTGRREDLPHWSLRVENTAGGSGCQSASYTSRIAKSQQNSPLLRHIKGKMTRGWWLPALSVEQSPFGHFRTIARAICSVWPFEGQCNMTRAVNIWRAPGGFLKI